MAKNDAFDNFFTWLGIVFLFAMVSLIPVIGTYSHSKNMEEKEKKSFGDYAGLTFGYIISIFCVAVTLGVLLFPGYFYFIKQENVFST